MKLETGWNHCTFKADCYADRELLMNLFNRLHAEEEGILELSKDSSELIIATYFSLGSPV